MGSASNNLVILEGNRADLLKFKKEAYKNDSEAFKFEKLLPLPSYYTERDGGWGTESSAYFHLFYGNGWGTGFSVLSRETENTLIYFFNSRDSIANLEFIAEKYYNLELTHIGVTTDQNESHIRWNYYKYSKGQQLFNYQISEEEFDFQNSSDLYTYEYISEIYIKFKDLVKREKYFEYNKYKNVYSLTQSSKNLHFYNFDQARKTNDFKLFFKLYHRFEYVLKNKDLYDNILNDVENLNKQDLKWQGS